MSKFFFSGLAGVMLLAPMVAGAITIEPPGGKKTLTSVLDGIINTSVMIILPIAVIVILIAAFFILKSNGDSGKQASGKKILTYGLVGLAVVIIAAGSGQLLKNFFGIKSVDYVQTSVLQVSDLFGFNDEQLSGVCGVSELKQQISDANMNEDYNSAQSAYNKLLELQSASVLEEQHGQAEAAGVNIYDSEAGLEVLKYYSSDLGSGWYSYNDGKYNPDSKEFVDSDGTTYQNVQLLYDGSIKF